MHSNTNRALMHAQASQLVDMLVTIEPQYRMMISFGYNYIRKLIYTILSPSYSASSDSDAACMAIINEIITKLPRSIETGFGPSARRMTFENALSKIGDKLGRCI